jgi:hypothetical protein
LCLNFIENGKCHVNGKKCILGPRGASARNEDHECELHGNFDVWLLRDSLLVTDLGFPSDEPIQSLALGVNEIVATRIASQKSKLTGTHVTTSRRSCIRCGALYWTSEHARTSGLTRRGYATFCPRCLSHIDNLEAERRLGEQRHWCG